MFARTLPFLIIMCASASAQETYDLRGVDRTRGEFSGRLTLERDSSGQLRVERDITFGRGGRELLRGQGHQYGRRVRAELRGTRGAAGRVVPGSTATATRVVLSLRFAPSGEACVSECTVGGVAASQGQGVRPSEDPSDDSQAEADDGGAEGRAPGRRGRRERPVDRALGAEGWRSGSVLARFKKKRRRRPGVHRAPQFVVDWSDTSVLPPLQDAGGEGFTVFRGIPFVAGEDDDEREIHYNDVEQQGLATCYLAAGLIAVAKSDPAMIRKMITDHRDGTYSVYLHNVVGGTKDANITIDNRFPYETEDADKLPAFFPLADTQAVGNDVIWELWPQIVEKAWARFKGGYEEIEWSRSSRVFEFVSGVKSKTHHTKNLTPTQIEAAIRKALAAGHPVALGSKSSGGDAAADLNLVGLHSYTVMQEKDGGFVLFNPWHSGHPPRPLTGKDIKAGFTRVYEGRF